MLKDLDTLVRRLLDEPEDTHLDVLRRFLRIRTVSGASDAKGQAAYREAMDQCLGLVREEAHRLGLDFRDHEGLACVVEKPGTKPDEGSIGIAAHLDVVPAGDGWDHDPFGAEVADGEVWGRGTQDDKGPVAMAFAALDLMQRLGLEPEKDVRLLFGTLEETDDWPDMDLLLERERPPDITLVPDGAFPVIVGEKGIMTMEWQAQWQESPAQEGLRFIGLRCGERHNVVPDAARAWFTCAADSTDAAQERLEALPHVHEVVRDDEAPPPIAGDAPCFEVRYRGEAAHGAFPYDGHNAALDALDSIRDLMGDEGVGAFAGFLLEHCRALDGKGLGLDRSHEKMGRSTLNLGIVEAGPQHGHAQVNVRWPLGMVKEEVQECFLEAAKAAPGSMRITTRPVGRPQDPVFVDPEDHPRLIRSLQASYQVATGRQPRLASIAGTTYAKVFPLAVAFGPQDESSGEPILAHQRNERLKIERHRENIRIYVLALALLACDPDDVKAAVEKAMKAAE